MTTATVGRQVATAVHSAANAQLIRPRAVTLSIRLCIRTAPFAHRRLYATPSRPKKAVGEASRPIKRATKKVSTDETSKEEAAAQKLKAKKEAAASRKATADKKKAASAAQKLKAKEKAAASKKAIADKKLKQKKKAAASKKVIADKKKAAAAAQKSKAKEKAALNPPHIKSANPYIFFSIERRKTASYDPYKDDQLTAREAFDTLSRDTRTAWKALSPADVVHYNHLANTAKAESIAAYEAWVSSHTIEEIARANVVRRKLRREHEATRKSHHKSKWQPIVDERQVKRPVNAYATFMVNRIASGDFRHVGVIAYAPLIAQEWKALSEDEKKKYQDIGVQDRQRYTKECNLVYGHEPPSAQQAEAAL